MGVDPELVYLILVFFFQVLLCVYRRIVALIIISPNLFLFFTHIHGPFIVVANCLPFSLRHIFFHYLFLKRRFDSSSVSASAAVVSFIRSSQCQHCLRAATHSYLFTRAAPLCVRTPPPAAAERKCNGVTDSICALPGAYTSVFI